MRNGRFYLANLWSALRSEFNVPIPNVCIAMGFPSRGARSKASRRAPGEILVQEWKGSAIETALVSIHPERFESVEQVALSVLFVVGNEVYGSRRNLGSETLGVTMNRETGDLEHTADDKGTHAQATLARIVRSLGAIPQGFAEMPEPKTRQTTRLAKYTCNVCGKIMRGAGEMGKVLHGDDGGQFVLQVKSAQSVVAAPEPPAPTQAENIRNVMTAVRSGAAKVVHGRNFGAEATA